MSLEERAESFLEWKFQSFSKELGKEFSSYEGEGVLLLFTLAGNEPSAA